MLLENKVGLITGSSRGIGRAVALALAGEGAHVAVNYSRDAEGAEAVSREVSAMGRRSGIFQADVSAPGQAEAMIQEVTQVLGPIDVLVNNAGIARDTLLLRMKEDDWTQVLGVNLTGVFHCTKAVLRSMVKRRKGRIINISSVVGITGNAGQANYAASKAGIIGFTRSIAREVGSRGITVNAVAPGYVETGMTEGLQDDIKAKMLSEIPMGRFGTPEDIARVVLFLSSDLSEYMTGQVLVVDGGMIMI